MSGLEALRPALVLSATSDHISSKHVPLPTLRLTHPWASLARVLRPDTKLETTMVPQICKVLTWSWWVSESVPTYIDKLRYPISIPPSLAVSKSLSAKNPKRYVLHNMSTLCVYIYIININYITIIVRVYMYIHLHSHAHTPMDVDENKLATCKDASTATTWRGRLPASWDPVGHRS